MKDPSSSNSELALPDQQNKAASNIPGWSGLKEWISKDIPLDTIRAKIREVGDIANSMHSANGSKEMIASIKNHPAIYWTSSRFTNARKRADLYHNVYIKPLEKAVIQLTNGERAGLLASALKAEMFADKRMTDDTLRQLGLNDKEIGVYKQFRQEFDVALKKLNEYRVSRLAPHRRGAQVVRHDAEPHRRESDPRPRVAPRRHPVPARRRPEDAHQGAGRAGGADPVPVRYGPLHGVRAGLRALRGVPVGPPVTVAGLRNVALQIATIDAGLLYLFALGSLQVYGTSLAGWASNNKLALLGGVRATSQMIIYEVSLGLSLVGTMMAYRTLRLEEMVAMQGTAALGPVPALGILIQPVGFLIFFASAFAETKRAPFDLPEGESEIV